MLPANHKHPMLRCPVIVFAPAPFSLALSYNRLVLAGLKRVRIGRNHSGATVPR